MDKPNGDEPKEVPESMVIVRFAGAGSVNMQLDFRNVIPLQIAALAWYLEKQAETGFYQQQIEQQQRAEQQKIAVPTLGVRKPIVR